jgi:hypothetical protein
MHKKMSPRTLWTDYWRTAVTGLLMLDFFLFTTGNPSLTYSFFGGWFEVTLIAATIITIFYGYDVLQGKKSKRAFALHLLVIGLFSIALLVLSEQARLFASDRLEAQVISFVNNPTNNDTVASAQERNLMEEITKGKYSMEIEGFIPTFRRMDYLLSTESHEKYRLIVIMNWNGVAQISLRRVDS